jgi:hypothetical protein
MQAKPYIARTLDSAPIVLYSYKRRKGINSFDTTNYFIILLAYKPYCYAKSIHSLFFRHLEFINLII